MYSEKFSTQSLFASTYGEVVSSILRAALEVVDSLKVVNRHLHRENNCLIVGDLMLDLAIIDRIFVIGFGKASVPMTTAAFDILDKHFTRGIIVTKSIPTWLEIEDSRITIFEGAHPVPDERSLVGAKSILKLLKKTTKNDLVIFLISGGGSALLTMPVPGISLNDIQVLTKSLLACGATINEINCLRKHLSQVKGGGLARFAAPAQVITLILSDVIGDPLDVIASGPTVPDPTTFEDALAILEKYQITNKIPKAIKDILEIGTMGELPETPKDGDPIFNKVQNYIIGNNFLAAQAAISQANSSGFNTLLLTTSLRGEARFAGQSLAAITRQVHATGDPIPRPACLVAGGETTVTVTGDGLGGRNLELALSSVTELAGIPDIMLIAFATDGEDGPTDAAGAIVTGETLQRGWELGLYPLEFLQKNDSYHFFEPLGDLLKTGSTHTNVCDLNFIFCF